MNTAQQKLTQRIQKINSLLCVGLDADFKRLPAAAKAAEFPQFEFNKAIIDATHEFVCSYKPNIAYYESLGEQGMKELQLTMEYLQTNYPDIFTICDAKRADIGSTNDAYATGIFDVLGFDAITLHPYLGRRRLWSQ